jgi:hypothetical protein
MRFSRFFAILLVGAGAAGCTARSTAEVWPRTATHVITTEQIQTNHRGNSLELVETLRPGWLRTRGSDSTDPRLRTVVQVYVDGMRMGGPETLRGISSSVVSSMQYLSGIEAAHRYGLDHGSGAILITTRR